MRNSLLGDADPWQQDSRGDDLHSDFGCCCSALENTAGPPCVHAGHDPSWQRSCPAQLLPEKLKINIRLYQLAPLHQACFCTYIEVFDRSTRTGGHAASLTCRSSGMGLKEADLRGGPSLPSDLVSVLWKMFGAEHLWSSILEPWEGHQNVGT